MRNIGQSCSVAYLPAPPEYSGSVEYSMDSARFKKVFTPNTQIAQRLHGRFMLNIGQVVLCFLRLPRATSVVYSVASVRLKVFTRNTQIAPRLHGRIYTNIGQVVLAFSVYSVHFVLRKKVSHRIHRWHREYAEEFSLLS
jgi:hypothetical protein